MRFIFLAFLPVLLLAQDPDDAAARQSDTASVTAGRAQFQQTCGFCHGKDGRGASGPDLIRSSLVSHDVNAELLGPFIRSGRPEKGMPAFQLPDSTIKEIASFLHSEAKIASSVARRIPSEYPLEKLLIGDVAAGRSYFNGKGDCHSCHSPAGDLQHIASKYKPFDLQTRIAFPSGRNPTLKVKDSSGQTFSGEQVYADEFVLTLRDAAGWRHTWKRTAVEARVTDPLAAHVQLLKSYTDNNIHDLFAYLETLK